MFHPLSLRDRILAWYGGVLLAVLGFALGLIHWRINAETLHHVSAQMTITGRVVESLQDERTATLISVARLAGEEPRLAATMGTRDRATIEDLLRRDLIPRLETGFARVTDTHGITLADTTSRAAWKQDLSHDPAVRAALAGQATGGTWVSAREIYLVATAPIRVGGQDLGTVTVGRRVTDRMAAQLYQDTGSEVTFFAGTRVAATSWSDPMRAELVAIRRSLPAARGPRSFRLRMGGQQMMCQLIPLRGDHGIHPNGGRGGPPGRGHAPVGLLLIQNSLDAALRPYINIQRSLTAFGLLGLLVAVLGSIIVAGGVTQPLRRIARAAHGLMQGDWTQRAPVTSQDEVGLLAETFNRMAERLERWDSDMRAAVAERTRELDAVVARLYAAYQQMRQFNADASHELRTPLTVIRGEAEVALRSARSQEQYQAVLQSIQEETERMSRIIEQLLLLARADSGELVLERQAVALDDLVREVAHRAGVLAVDRGVRLRVESLPHTLVQGDEDRLRQLTLNLIDNALKYTPEGGEVVVRLHCEVRGEGPNGNGQSEPAFPSHTSVPGHALAVLEVRDTGIGIAEADLPRIFDRFYRVDRARSRRLVEEGWLRAAGSTQSGLTEPSTLNQPPPTSSGSGLGLAICRWIVEAHGGRIDVRSQLGVGSSFTVRLPGAAVPALDGVHPETEVRSGD